MPLECDLELNEDPDNPLQKYLASPCAGPKQNGLSAKEGELLKLVAFIGVPIPIAVADILAGPGSAPRIRTLLEKRYLRKERQMLSLSAPGNFPAAARGTGLLLDPWPPKRIGPI